MQRSRQDLYRQFLDFIQSENQRERTRVNRRMLSVAFWCFFLPTVISLAVLLMVKANVLPIRFRSHLDWIVLLFPTLYSIYFLSSEVLSDLPAAFRRGGMATTLVQCLREGEWREKVCEGMRRAVPASREDWTWIMASFRIDLDTMRYRTRYLTALAGAVFFLLMQGIDSLSGEDEGKVTWARNSITGFIEAATSTGDFTQFVGLGLFLVLLYLSGNQTSHMLERFLNCAELMAKESPGSN